MSIETTWLLNKTLAVVLLVSRQLHRAVRNISDSRGRSTINIYYCIEVTVENQSCVTITKTHTVRTDESYVGLSNKGFSAVHIITIAGTTTGTQSFILEVKVFSFLLPFGINT